MRKNNEQLSLTTHLNTAGHTVHGHFLLQFLAMAKFG